jgi:NAD-dependent deacetylase
MVQPAASLLDVAAAAGARVIIVNAQATPYDHLAAEVIRDPISQAVPDLIGRLVAR